MYWARVPPYLHRPYTGRPLPRLLLPQLAQVGGVPCASFASMRRVRCASAACACVFRAWQRVQSVWKLRRSDSPPPCATGTMWSASQKSPSCGRRSMRFTRAESVDVGRAHQQLQARLLGRQRVEAPVEGVAVEAALLAHAELALEERRRADAWYSAAVNDCAQRSPQKGESTAGRCTARQYRQCGRSYGQLGFCTPAATHSRQHS